MSMNKKEQAAFDALLLRVEILAALRWTAPVEKDLPPLQVNGDGEYTYGWDFNEHTLKVFKAWSSSIYHGDGHDPKALGRTASQGAAFLFSTPQKALAALRHAVELKAAKDLLRVDKITVEDN